MGAQEVLDCLKPVEVAVADLTAAASATAGPRLVKVVFREEDMVERKEKDIPFNLLEYYAHPERYEGCFEKYLRTLMCWSIAFIGNLDIRVWSRASGRKNYLPVVPAPQGNRDISCDIEGSVELTVRAPIRTIPATFTS